MSAQRTVPVLLWSLLLVSLSIFGYRVAQRGRFSAPYSSYGAGPEGTLALFQLAGELGFTPQRLAHEYTNLAPGTLFALADCHGTQVRKLLRPEREALLDWVTQGGLLIIAGAQDYVPESSGISFESAHPCAPKAANRLGKSPNQEHAHRALLAIPAGPPLAHALPFHTTKSRVVRAAPDSEATTLLQSEDGPLGLTAPLGRGRIVVLSTSDMLTNRGLTHGGGVLITRVLEAFAPRGPIWFDEYHLGMGERRSLIHYLRELGYGTALLQTILVLLCFLISRASRLKPAQARSQTRTNRPFLSTLSNLYTQTQDTVGAIEILTGRSLRCLARAHRAPPMPNAALARWFADTGLREAADSALRLEELRKPLLPGETLLQRTHEIEQALSVGVRL